VPITETSTEVTTDTKDSIALNTVPPTNEDISKEIQYGEGSQEPITSGLSTLSETQEGVTYGVTTVQTNKDSNLGINNTFETSIYAQPQLQNQPITYMNDSIFYGNQNINVPYNMQSQLYFYWRLYFDLQKLLQAGHINQEQLHLYQLLQQLL